MIMVRFSDTVAERVGIVCLEVDYANGNDPAGSGRAIKSLVSRCLVVNFGHRGKRDAFGTCPYRWRMGGILCSCTLNALFPW